MIKNMAGNECFTVSLPKSKSVFIRYLILEYLINHIIPVIKDEEAEDIKIVHRNLQIIDNEKKREEKKLTVIDVQDCGAAFRFLMALLSYTEGLWFLTGTPRLLDRPVTPLVSALKSAGAEIEKTEKGGWIIKGKILEANESIIDCRLSSQFASALLLITPITKNKKIKMEPPSFPSKSYVAMTKEIIYKMTHRLSVLPEADWSAAAFWYAYLLLQEIHSPVILEGLQIQSCQGDAILATWFKDWGIQSSQTAEGVKIEKIKKETILPQYLNFTNCSDLVPLMAVLSVLYPFELHLTGIQNLNYKESNRLDILITELSRYTDIIKNREDYITIHQRKKELPSSFYFDSWQDHRLVMAWALFATSGSTHIENAAVVKKSYPNFLIALESASSFHKN